MTMRDLILEDIEGMKRHEGPLGFGSGRYEGMAVVLTGPTRGNQPTWSRGPAVTVVALSEADFANMDDVTLFRVYQRIFRRFYTQM